jgi:YD repeat-containing protein
LGLEGTSTWTYDTKSKGIGKPAVVTGPNGYKKELSYDALGRVSSTTLTAKLKKDTHTPPWNISPYLLI